MSKVIARLSAGTANSIYEFFAGYAFAQETESELILDIGLTQNHAFAYNLDYLNIPTIKKISYYSNHTTISYNDSQGILVELKDESQILCLADYHCLDDAKQYIGKDVILSDYFFDQKYYYKYWNECKQMFMWGRGTSNNIEGFKNLIADRISVGVHFRRGDMLYADFAINITDDYYKAAIEFVKKKVDKDALFCVFSDDIEYAEKLLGRDDNIRYIHFLGYDDTDLEELICLSLCDHRILSNNSSYSLLADKLNDNDNRLTILQGEIESNCFRKLITAAYRAKCKIQNKIEGLRKGKKEFSYYYLDQYIIKRFASRFFSSKESSINTDLFCEGAVKNTRIDSKEEANLFLDSILQFELNHYILSKEMDIRLRLQKCKAYYLLEKYDRAICQADFIYGYLREDVEFWKLYSEILKKCGIYEEAALVDKQAFCGYSFIMFPLAKTCYSNKLCNMGMLAKTLFKMGGEVIVVSSPIDDVEKEYIENNEYMINRHGARLGGRQYTYDAVEKKGLKCFIHEIANKTRKKTYVISERKELFFQKASSARYLYPLFFDELLEDISKKKCIELDDCLDNSIVGYIDGVISPSIGQINYTKADYRVIKYDIDNTQHPFWIREDRWTGASCHRVSRQILNMCSAMSKCFLER